MVLALSEGVKIDIAVICSSIVMSVIIFFFSSRRRHTRFDCDWSSDVCSSDLPTGLTIDDRLLLTLASMRSDGNILPLPSLTVEKVNLRGVPVAVVEVLPSEEIGRASCRERV